jgi:predicted Rossmann-fold nucleotide-binding protein
MLNTEGYFDGLLKFLHHAVSEGFVRPLDVERLIIEREPAALIDRLASSF